MRSVPALATNGVVESVIISHDWRRDVHAVLFGGCARVSSWMST